MSTILRRVIAASIPAAMLAGSALSSDAAPRFFTLARPFATAPTLYAGGATLPIIAYLGKALSSGTASLPVAGSGSVFAYFAAIAGGAPIEYCATGSGKGKGVFDGPAGTVSSPCANAASGATGTVGFDPGTRALPVVYPNITGSDSPLSTTSGSTEGDYQKFIANAGVRKEPTELPALVGSVGIFYNNNQVTSQLSLTTSQLCSVVTNKITNWSQLGKPAKAIHFVYRADGSGTTFSFSNHLSAECSGISANQLFTPGVVTTPPAGSLGETGNSAVASTVAATDGAIGYVETANASTYVSGSGKALAKVDGKDPIRNLPESAYAITSSSLQADYAITSTTGPAQSGPIPGVPGTKGCVELVKPSGYAKLTAGYPIVAVTYLLFGQGGNGSSTAALQNLVATVTNETNYASGKITKVNRSTSTAGTGTTGYASLSPSIASAIAGKASGCIVAANGAAPPRAIRVLRF